jgi:hypothetical protein
MDQWKITIQPNADEPGAVSVSIESLLDCAAQAAEAAKALNTVIDRIVEPFTRQAAHCAVKEGK